MCWFDNMAYSFRIEPCLVHIGFLTENSHKIKICFCFGNQKAAQDSRISRFHSKNRILRFIIFTTISGQDQNEVRTGCISTGHSHFPVSVRFIQSGRVFGGWHLWTGAPAHLFWGRGSRCSGEPLARGHHAVGPARVGPRPPPLMDPPKHHTPQDEG